MISSIVAIMKLRTEVPNKVWVSDITYIKTKQGWVYLCIIIDLFSRKIVGWECSNRINNELVLHTFLKAYWQRKPQKGLMFHSDRGSQYTSNEFQKVLRNLEVTQSLSRKANCLDNAVAESCFHTIKQELGRSFTSRDVANSMIFEYIEAFYNSYSVTPQAIWQHLSHFKCVLYKTLQHQIFSFA